MSLYDWKTFPELHGAALKRSSDLVVAKLEKEISCKMQPDKGSSRR